MIEYICSFEEEYGFLVSESMKYGEELIRCKDCKHMHEDGAESYCDDSGRYIDGTDFCKWAERKEECYNWDTVAIDNAPTVDAEPVRHGYWIEVYDDKTACKCSHCGNEYNLYEEDINGYPYCAKCGAKMDGESNEQ